MNPLNIKYPIILFFLLLFTGCFPEDDPVVPLDIEIVQIPYSMYDTQAWFSLNEMAVVSHNAFTEWDLGFESSDSGHHIILNTSKFMHAGNTFSTDFPGITTNICDTMVYDDSSGDPDKTAIGNWADFSDPANPVYTGYVYIIDLGVDNNGVSYGTKKVTFDSFDSNSYTVHFSNLDGSEEHTSVILTDAERSFTLFSFNTGGVVVPIQPVTTGWDICFTQYSTILYDDNNVATPYLVRGVYSNMYGTTAARDTINSFNDIRLDDVPNYTFSSAQDAVGYTWKDYEDDSYKINPNIFYIIKDHLGDYYKLKFTGFYNSLGERGYPSFQCIKLSD